MYTPPLLPCHVALTRPLVHGRVSVSAVGNNIREGFSWMTALGHLGISPLFGIVMLLPGPHGAHALHYTSTHLVRYHRWVSTGRFRGLRHQCPTCGQTRRVGSSFHTSSGGLGMGVSNPWWPLLSYSSKLIRYILTTSGLTPFLHPDFRRLCPSLPHPIPLFFALLSPSRIFDLSRRSGAIVIYYFIRHCAILEHEILPGALPHPTTVRRNDALTRFRVLLELPITLLKSSSHIPFRDATTHRSQSFHHKGLLQTPSSRIHSPWAWWKTLLRTSTSRWLSYSAS